MTRIRLARTTGITSLMAVIAEMPGRTRPDQGLVMVAHIQEPGANDDASGAVRAEVRPDIWITSTSARPV